MRTIKISEEVWQEIAKRGNFGETEDDVLRREFNLPEDSIIKTTKATGRRGRGNVTFATNTMTSRVQKSPDGEQLLIDFASGARRMWPLGDKSDKEMIRRVRDEAVAFALANDASDPGQTNAVRKALTDGGYFLKK